MFSNDSNVSVADTEVLVCGGGITGLILALSFAKNGIPVQVIEKQPRTFGRRGLGVHGRSLEFEKMLGLLPDIMKHARPVFPNVVYDPEDPHKVAGSIVIFEHMENTESKLHINTFCLSQDVHEALVMEHLAELGVSVNMQTELVGFGETGDRVISRVRDASGVLREVHSKWLIGTDGAHSTVRKTLGMPFSGHHPDAKLFVLADVQIASVLDKDVGHIWGDMKSKGYIMFPPDQDSDIWNVVAMGSELDHLGISASHDAFVKDFVAFTGRTDINFVRVLRLLNYQPHMRLVDSMRSGRVLLAGDAAHVHSATGAQGLNSGIQDAMNLGWKLSLVIKGLASSTLLDSYSSERLPVLAMMLQLTTELHTQTINSEAGDYSALYREFALRQFGVNYRQSKIVLDELVPPTDKYDPYRSGHDDMARAGDRAPDARGLDDGSSVKTMYDLFDNRYHTVLVFPSSSASAQAFVDYFAACEQGIFKVIIVLPRTDSTMDKVVGSAVIIDSGSHARNNYRISPDDTVAVVVRPDAYIGARVRDVEGVKKYLGFLASP